MPEKLKSRKIECYDHHHHCVDNKFFSIRCYYSHNNFGSYFILWCNFVIDNHNLPTNSANKALGNLCFFDDSSLMPKVYLKPAIVVVLCFTDVN